MEGNIPSYMIALNVHPFLDLSLPMSRSSFLFDPPVEVARSIIQSDLYMGLLPISFAIRSLS